MSHDSDSASSLPSPNSADLPTVTTLNPRNPGLQQLNKLIDETNGIVVATAGVNSPRPAGHSLHSDAASNAAAQAAESAADAELNPKDKQKKRLARKAELARASRKRKKQYVNELEHKLNSLTQYVQTLNTHSNVYNGGGAPMQGFDITKYQVNKSDYFDADDYSDDDSHVRSKRKNNTISVPPQPTQSSFTPIASNSDLHSLPNVIDVNVKQSPSLNGDSNIYNTRGRVSPISLHTQSQHYNANATGMLQPIPSNNTLNSMHRIGSMTSPALRAATLASSPATQSQLIRINSLNMLTGLDDTTDTKRLRNSISSQNLAYYNVMTPNYANLQSSPNATNAAPLPTLSFQNITASSTLDNILQPNYNTQQPVSVNITSTQTYTQEPVYSIKCVYKGETRRFALNNNEFNYSTLLLSIRALYPISTFHIHYVDDENETVPITSTAELHEAYRVKQAEQSHVSHIQLHQLHLDYCKQHHHTGVQHSDTSNGKHHNCCLPCCLQVSHKPVVPQPSPERVAHITEQTHKSVENRSPLTMLSTVSTLDTTMANTTLSSNDMKRASSEPVSVDAVTVKQETGTMQHKHTELQPFLKLYISDVALANSTSGYFNNQLFTAAQSNTNPREFLHIKTPPPSSINSKSAAVTPTVTNTAS